MAEIQTTSWDETAASNNSAAPNGFPEGMAPSGVNDSAREVMAQVKRWQNRLQGRADAGTLISSAGAAATFTVDYDTAPASLYTGLLVSFKANASFDAAATVNVNSLGAKNVQKITTAGYVNITAADIKITQHVDLKFDATLDKWVMMSPTPPDASGFIDPMTTRGDIIVRSASAAVRLALGAAGTYPASDGIDMVTTTPATAAEYRTGTSTTKLIPVASAWGALAEVTLTDGASVTPDLATGIDFTVTLAGNRTLANATNVKVGQRGRIRIVQDGTGGRTLAFGTNYEFANGVAVTISTAAAAQDVLYYDCISATRILCSLVRAIS